MKFKNNTDRSVCIAGYPRIDSGGTVSAKNKEEESIFSQCPDLEPVDSKDKKKEEKPVKNESKKMVEVDKPKTFDK